MELTNTYISTKQKVVTQEEYFAYREKKAKEYMAMIEKGLGKTMTHRELKNMEFGFKKGMDIITNSGRYMAREVLEA